MTILPVLFLYTLIAILPVGFALWASLHRIPLTQPQWTFVGLENYAQVFELDRFWGSMWRGTLFMVGSTLVQLAVGLWMALVINRMERGQRLLSTLVFTSYLIPTIIVTLIALFMLDPFVGVLHQFGASLGLWEGYVLGAATWNLPGIGEVSLALPAVVLIGSWKFSVFITIFALAQLRSIPNRFYEAAKICGATSWEMFRDITLPRLKGAILVAVLLRSVFMFNKYDIIWQLTQGGPGYETTTMPILAYRETFEGSAYGLGNAIAVVMFCFLAVGAVAYFVAFNPSQEVDT
ncbi:carbohydrate ABC transporter permease [Halomarina oriensis]|uniref:ABC transporter permease subunit n=1 Tax=Halomarina oriensis TaxID=671145 RepID=A0A6B0GSQ2_9EURY|nr:sugar ABC transporter permease [Halomarina oriensis]MWG36347.1 ABC transporter permease subunit [Halomarina oriensis]